MNVLYLQSNLQLKLNFKLNKKHERLLIDDFKWMITNFDRKYLNDFLSHFKLNIQKSTTDITLKFPELMFKKCVTVYYLCYQIKE